MHILHKTLYFYAKYALLCNFYVKSLYLKVIYSIMMNLPTTPLLPSSSVPRM